MRKNFFLQRVEFIVFLINRHRSIKVSLFFHFFFYSLLPQFWSLSSHSPRRHFLMCISQIYALVLLICFSKCVLFCVHTYI